MLVKEYYCVEYSYQLLYDSHSGFFTVEKIKLPGGKVEESLFIPPKVLQQFGSIANDFKITRDQYGKKQAVQLLQDVSV